MAKNIVCNVRMTEEERYALRAAALKNKTTVQDVLYEAAMKYINLDAESDNDPDYEDDYDGPSDESLEEATRKMREAALARGDFDDEEESRTEQAAKAEEAAAKTKKTPKK